MKIGVLLSGNGVYDGSEIQEAVFTLLSIDENGAEAICMAPDINQHHVVNHLSGEEMNEQRNVFVESARIARGNIRKITDVSAKELDALVIPGGFGAAKNLTKWAFSGPEGEINNDVLELIRAVNVQGKPIVGFCMGPTVISKALQGTGIHSHLTVGTDKEASPYDIAAISQGMEKAGSIAEMKSVREISVDEENKIITAPCYMMEASIKEVNTNIKLAMDKLFEMIKK
ncbi:MAG TPA: isoprenoid biosynthesis protein ElbB [Flavobacteriales bacterium]|nr:isoprenoid biosynthesis protein ElbB [Flavobacteriales bacterium]